MFISNKIVHHHISCGTLLIHSKEGNLYMRHEKMCMKNQIAQ